MSEEGGGGGGALRLGYRSTALLGKILHVSY